MERLTKRWEAQPYPNLAGKVICEYKECDSTKSCENCIHGRYKDRLAAYEDTELEPDTISKIRDIVLDISGNLDRLRELAQADKEGRCVVLPVKPGDSVRFAKNPREKNETVDAITIYSDGRMNFLFHEYGVKTEWVDRWSEDDACKYVPVESAKAALRREQDE